jgi:nicotinamidase-related amidase
LSRDRSLLLVVDIQERLAPHVLDHEALIARVEALLHASRLFGVPVCATEHSAARIGPLIPRLRTRLAADEILAKTRFGAADHPELAARLRSIGRTQVLVAGMEAHVCVLQTTLGLAASGFDAFVVVDAIGSRAERALDRTLALERMRDAGAVAIATETALFEWTRDADDPRFRDVLELVKALPSG